MLPFILRRPSYKISYGHVHRSQEGDASDMPRVASSIHGPAMSDLLRMLPGGAKEDRNDYVSVLIKNNLCDTVVSVSSRHPPHLTTMDGSGLDGQSFPR